ncbi:hypothetical protein LSH36_120g00026 [Paralvinella palmiformis]|uniref:Peptidase S54 rhomboid domain-containing protein n=1 Tax=Paralvinella palmiformis TaxID=53620 RepID=A0AAD9JYQ2_9ANNE|nr:hypothetical protein LSH36_120g00026 [Paralvinella palmiformis]
MSLSSDGAGRGDLPLQETVQPDVSTDDTSTDGCHQTTKCGGDKLAAKDKKRSFTALKRSMTKTLSDFFLGDINQDPLEDQSRSELARDKWRCRSLLLHNNRLIGGKVKPEVVSMDMADSVFESASQSGSVRGAGGQRIVDPLHRPPGASRQDSRTSRSSHLPPARQWSTVSSGRRSLRHTARRLQRKESVVKMAYDGCKDWMIGSKKSKKHPVMRSRSFAPASVSEGGMDDYYDTIKSPAVDSVFVAEDANIDDVFFDTPTPTSAMLTSPFAQMRLGVPGTTPPMATIMERSSDGSETTRTSQLEPTYDTIDSADKTKLSSDNSSLSPKVVSTSLPSDEKEITVPIDVEHQEITEPSLPIKSGWRIGVHKPLALPRQKVSGPDTPDFFEEDMPDGPFQGMSRIGRAVLDSALDFDNSDRREIGRGFIGQLFDLRYRQDRMNSEIEAQIEAIDEHRPYFTYWVTFVQVVIYIISVSVYGIAPIGFEDTFIYGEILTSNLAIQKESYIEKDNLWIGPRQADLIHLGAKYSPCMRKDKNIEDAIAWDQAQEDLTACCIRNDGSGCVQTPEKECSDTLSKWYSWKRFPDLAYNKTAGLVCGTDPRKCKEPLSQGAYQWPSSITEWPVCKSAVNVSENDANYPHMTCSVAGRPCCIGIQGECIITTREYCEFRKGFFHDQQFLCSQVSCMNEICGMIEFLDPKVPDQFYRLWTSLFLHAGLLQLLVSVGLQIFIMRDMEKLAGWLRLAIIYIGSGIAGSLASAIFLPYHVEAGPAGSQFGVLAMLFVEVIQNFYIIKHPWRTLAKQFAILLFLFILGLLPYIDNYAHLIGFLIGFMLSFALLPYITFNKLDRRGKIAGIVVCLIIASGLFAVLIILFYVSPVYNCPYCHYFNCIPFTPKFCDSMRVEIRRANQ